MKLNKIRNYNLFTDFFILHDSRMILLSLYGSEQVIKSMLANIDINNLSSLKLEDYDVGMQLANTSNLKTMRKKVINDIYDDMFHYMVYSSDINYVEGNVTAYVISPRDGHDDAVWDKVKSMTVTPLLDSWKDRILSFLRMEDKITKCDVYGDKKVSCSYVEIDSLTYLNDFVSSSIKQRIISY